MQQFVHSFASMGTVVSMQVLSSSNSSERDRQRDSAIARAAQWFHEIESACNRFDETSELQRLCRTAHERVVVSDVLFECVQFAVAVADATDGAFDPTVGARMMQRGFNRDYRTGAEIVGGTGLDGAASYRDIELDEETHAITLRRHMQLDLGAVAKGLAVDMAARELRELVNFMINAGGDLYLGGHNADGAEWNVGIKHPRERGAYIHTLPASDCAVCTSGDYERVAADGSGHIMNALSNNATSSLASVTVVAPSAMVADALGTAAFALGAEDGLAFLQQQGVQALLITPQLDLLHTFDTERE